MFTSRFARLVVASCAVWMSFGLHVPSAGAAPRRPSPPAALEDEHARPLPMWVRAAPRPHELRHRGDWERADALALVYHWEWARAVARLARVASRFVDVAVLVARDEPDAPRFASRRNAHDIRVLHLGTDSPWIRDYGPLQVFDRGQPRWIDFAYASDRADDDRVPAGLAHHFGMPIEAGRERLDGGGVASNGFGLCAITDHSLIESGFTENDPALPPFAGRLGCGVLAVLPALPGEATGHVDLFVQFLGPSLVAVGSIDAEREPGIAAALDHAARILSRAAGALGQDLRIVRVPIAADGDTFYSYINGTPVGPVFFMPTYDAVDPGIERIAHDALRAAMPERRIVPVRADEIVSYGGAIHCITSGLSLQPSKILYAHHRTTPKDFWTSVWLR